jgi:hypothetical protein
MLIAFVVCTTLLLATVLQEYLQRDVTSVVGSHGLLMLFVFMLVYGTVMHVEKYEEKFKAYRFLRTLPLTDREIVYSKFVLLILLALFAVTFLMSTASIFSINTWEHRTLNFLVPAAVLALLAGGTAYIGIFRWGYSACRTLIVFLYLLLILVCLGIPIILREILGESAIERYAAAVGAINLWGVLALGLPGYMGLMFLAARTRENQRS